MATRFYFPDNAAPAISPAFDAVWTNTAFATRHQLSTTKQGSAFTSDTHTIDGGYLFRQYISPPLAAQFIDDMETAKAFIRALESDLASNAETYVVIRLFSGDGLTERTKFYEGQDSLEFATSLTNRELVTLTNFYNGYNAQIGDVLVVEIGAWNTGGEYSASIEFGDNSASDLPEDEVSTDQYCPWIEFSQDLVFWNGTDEDVEYAASGYIKLCGTSVLNTALLTDYAADGYMQVCGECVIPDETEDMIEEYVADGAIYLCGESAFNTPPLDTYRADGFMQLCGEGKVDSTVPYVDPSISLITAYAAAGGVSLYGDCVLVKPEELRSEYVAAGTLLICGGCNLGIPSQAGLTTAYVAAGHILFGGSGGLIQGPVFAYAAQTESGPCLEISGDSKATFIYPALSDYAAEGGVSLVGDGILGGVPDEGSFETLVLTGNRSEIAFYTNFNFNSYAKYRGKCYGATEQGIFLLEGADDDGQGIVPGARIGPANYGTDREKRLRLVRCGGKCDQARVRVSSDTGLEEIKDVVGGRASISRKVQGREITLDIAGFETLNFLQIVPLILAKR